MGNREQQCDRTEIFSARARSDLAEQVPLKRADRDNPDQEREGIFRQRTKSIHHPRPQFWRWTSNF